MNLLYIAIVIVLTIIVAVPALYLLARQLQKREPYRSFMGLRTRNKLRFFKLLLTDPRVPRKVKVLPFLLVPYLAFPIDIIPDFIPVLGYVDDVAIVLGTLALVMRWTPRAVIDDLFLQLTEADSR